MIAERTLQELDLREEGVRVLGIVRSNGTYVGAPIGPTRVHAGDTLVVYGRSSDLAALAERPGGARGDEEHQRAVAERRRTVEREAEAEAQPGT